MRRYRKLLDFRAKKIIQKNDELWSILSSYISKTGSTGCSYIDYWELYSFIREKKPSEVLECSTGVSTIVMACAMMINEKENGVIGRITSMEESPKYYDLACQLLPVCLTKYVEIILSPKVEAYYCLFRGMKYGNVPDREYDFVFIDGPTTKTLSDGQKTFDFDFIDILAKSKKPISAIVDGRLSTCYVLNKILKRGKFRYDNVRSMGYVNSCTKSDMKTTNDFVNTYKDLK
ncbi:MAG: hypothetical protein AAB390_00280 [Patescibacteria group bacterium]